MTVTPINKSRKVSALGLIISWSFAPLIGLLGAAMALISVAVVPGAPGWFGVGLAELMLTIAIIDWRHFIIPDWLNAAGLILGLMYAGAQDPQALVATLVMAVARGVTLAAGFLALRWLYRWIRGREGLGLGDVKLAAVAGVWLDWLMLPVAIEFAALAALTFYGLRQARFGEQMSATSRLPFGVFLAPAIWVTWLLESAGLVWFGAT